MALDPIETARAEIAKIYIAAFGRVPDASGLDNWYNQYAAGLMTYDQIAQDFTNQAEYQATYPAIMTNTEYVTAIYNNVFGRAPDAGGLQNWVNQLDAGVLDRGNIMYSMLQTAATPGNDDGVRLENMATFGVQTILDKVPTDVATTELANITADPATVTAAEAAVATAVNPGETVALTTGVDTLVGTEKNDTFNAILDGANSTLTNLDTIDGAGGTDTLNIDEVTAAGLPTMTVSNIETINLRSAGAANITTSTGFTGLETLNVTQGTSATVTAATTTDVNVSGISGAITVDGGKTVVVNDATAAKTITIGATTAPAGTITVTDTDNSGANAIAVDGGTDVTVTATADTAMAGDITVGGITAASGAVVVTQNLNDDGTGANSGARTIAVTGGTTITVTENLTSNAKDETVTGALAAAKITATADANTTTVSVTQNESLTTFTKDAVAQVQETASVKFADLANGDTVKIGGTLVFTASKDLTAAEVAAAFANLTDPDTQSATGVTDNGYFTGSLAGWTSGAVSGDTVVFTSTAADDGVANGGANVIDLTATVSAGTAPTVTTTDGVDGVAAITSTNSITKGGVVIDDNTTATASVTTVTVDGYEGALIGNTNSMDALTTLSLANSGSTGTQLQTAQTTLDLTVNNVTSGVDLDNATANKSITDLTLNANTKDSAFALTVANLKNLTVNAAANLNISTSAYGTAMETATITGAGAVNLGDISGETAINTFDASANTGGVTATVEVDKTDGTLTGSIAEYKFSAGNDTVTLTSADNTAATVDVNITTLAGDDTVTLFTGVTGFAAGKTADAGDGTDTLSMAAADLTVVTGGVTFQDSISNFERVTVGAIANTTDDSGALAETLDLANLDNINYVNVSGVSVNASGDSDGDTASLAISNLANAGTINITSAILNDTAGGTDTGSLSIALADATGTADVLNFAMTDATDATGITNTGTVTANGIETVNITVSDKFVDANDDGID
ncbi:DUF4214 domain-containing protein, partial [Sulfurimonas sp.]